MKNKVNLMGRLGKDAQLIVTKNDSFMLAFNVATGGNKTLWHNVVFFDEEKIEKVETFLKKGVLVDIEGYLNPREYVKGGNTYRTCSVVANRILILDKPRFEEKQESPKTDHQEYTSSISDATIYDDDIPF